MEKTQRPVGLSGKGGASRGRPAAVMEESEVDSPQRPPPFTSQAFRPEKTAGLVSSQAPTPRPVTARPNSERRLAENEGSPTDTPRQSMPHRCSLQRSLPLSKSKKGKTESFEAWLAAKEQSEELSRQREREQRFEEQQKQRESEQRKRETLAAWEWQHDARARERRECEKQKRKMERIRKAQEQQQTQEHEQLCHQRFREWLAKKREQFLSSFMPISHRSSRHSFKSARESLGLIVIKPRLSLATFGVSVPASRKRLELSEFTPGE